MRKLYREHPIFDTYSLFDTETGQLKSVEEKELSQLLPPYRTLKDNPEFFIGGVEGRIQYFFGETFESHTRFPRRIYLQITRQCNLQCEYCFIKASEKLPHVPTPALMKMAETLGKQGLMEVRLTGGEPTLHPDFMSIVRKFHSENIYVSVATHGVWSAEIREFLSSIPNIWIVCSLDGDREAHERFRPGTFDAILCNLKYLKKKNPSARLRLTTVLTRHNLGQIHALGAIGRDVGAESITVIPLRPQLRNPAVGEAMVNAGEFKGVIEALIDAKERFGIPFTTTIESRYKDQIFSDSIVRKRAACAAGREATNLDFDYKKNRFIVYGCSYSPASDLLADERIRRPFLAGEFSPESPEVFAGIWNDESRWMLYRDPGVRSKECQDCAYLKQHHCTGSCPIQNIDYSQIDVEHDVLEQVKQQIIRTGEWYCYKNYL